MAKIQISYNFDSIIEEMDDEMLFHEEDNRDLGFRDLFPELRGKGVINLTPSAE